MPGKARTAVKKDKLFLFIEWLAHRPLLTELALTAITVLFGMQVLRALIPSIYWILGDRFGLSLIQLGLVGVGVFIIGFLSGPLSWLTGNRRLITFTVAGLGLVRLLMQVAPDLPLFNLGLGILGTIFFILFLPSGFEDARIRGGASVSNFILGLLGGLALDTAIYGAFGTYDMIWQTKLLPVLLTLLLFVFQLVFLIGTAPSIYSHSRKLSSMTSRISLGRSFTWLAIGPFLFLELVVFQNMPRLATLTGWPLPWAFGLTLIGQLAGLAAANLIISRNWRMLWPWALGAGVILIATLVFAYQQPASLIAILFFVGQVLISSIMSMILVGIASGTGRTRVSTVWIANGIGTVLFVLLIAAYYAVYEVKLPYVNQVVEVAAAGIIAACAIGAVILEKQNTKAEPGLWTVSIFALILLALPLAQITTWRTPVAANVPGEGFPIKVMTYNLNDGFNPRGKLDIDEIANIIEINTPDIIGLQEVSRGSVINGSLDMLEWLSYRLQMPYIYGPTQGPFRGNAIISRYPIAAYSRESLPPPDLFPPRGFIVALIDLPDGQQIKVIDAQFDNIAGDTQARQAEAQALTDFWNGLDSTIILGDFGAPRQSTEIRQFYTAGLDLAAVTSGTSYVPSQMTDYIWISPDLRTSDVTVAPGAASDHLPVVAVISR
jgi:endonuclease/exonuclease/phosphatase family metal-dependent hydrolase